jgi:hypothetical protein
MVEKGASEFALFETMFYIKTNNASQGSKVERLGSRMIRESLNQRKSYPMNSCGRTNSNFWKSEKCTLFKNVGY